jgi:oligopeptidase A
MFATFKTPNYDNFPKELKIMLDTHQIKIDELISNPNPTYATLLKPMQDMDEELGLFFTPLSHLNSVMNSDETQEAYENSLPLLSEFSTKLSHNKALYEKILSLKGSNDEEQKVINESIKEFRLSGVDLDDTIKHRLEEINMKLSELSNNFSQNLLNATNSFVLSLSNEDDIKGLPKNDILAARKDNNGEITYEFTLQMPSYISYMTYGPNRQHRETLYREYTTRAPENSIIIDELLALKNEEALLLGFENYASLALEQRDAASANEVISFLEEIASKAIKFAQKEVDELKEFALKCDGVENLQSYDVAYYSEKLKTKFYDFDETLVQPYFEQNIVLNGMFDMISSLLGVEFKEAEVKLWHESAKAFDIYEGGKAIARIFTDLEARSEKRSGAWMHDYESHFIDSKGNLHNASAFIVCNFAPATKQSPSLLRHDDVVTLFHEMGHAIHHLFGQSNERSLSGINGVAWDVVEFPSQFLENFAYLRSVLCKIGKHYETNEPIPGWMLEKIEQSKNFQASMAILRQVEFSLFDLKLHMRLHSGAEVQEVLDEVRSKTTLISPPSYNKFQNGFSHIFAGGYSAGYYSYKWAEVLSADAFFACIDENGAFDKEKAIGYKKEILAMGSARSMRELYNSWLGEEPKLDSLFRLYGLN